MSAPIGNSPKALAERSEFETLCKHHPACKVWTTICQYGDIAEFERWRNPETPIDPSVFACIVAVMDLRARNGMVQYTNADLIAICHGNNLPNMQYAHQAGTVIGSHVFGPQCVRVRSR